MRSHLMSLMTLISTTGAALGGDGSPVLMGDPVRVAPRAMARIAPDGQLSSPWYETGEGGISQTVCSTLLAFDNFEVDPAGVPTECYPPPCGMGSSRWFFGTAYANTFAANDMNVGCAGAQASESSRVGYAWYWGPCPSQGGTSRCLIAVFTMEDWQDCAFTGQGYAGTYSGILYDFGPLPCNPGNYFFTDVSDLCDFGLFHQLPFDGRGGYAIVLAQGTSGGFLVMAESGQCMLWGTKQGNPDHQGPFQYDDDNPRDGVHNFAPSDLGGECYNYVFGVCPDPLGAAIAFYGDSSESGGHPACSPICHTPSLGHICYPCDTNCDGSVNGFDVDPFVSILTGSGSPCDECSGDMNGDGSVNGFDVDGFVDALLTTTCEPKKEKMCEIVTFDVPKNRSGCVKAGTSPNITVTESFEMDATFKDDPPNKKFCECCEYRQYVKGKFERNGAKLTHPLCDYDGDGTVDSLDENNFKEDGVMWDQDSDGTLKCGQYGHRTPAAGNDTLGANDVYSKANRASGCQYDGFDKPGQAGLKTGDTYNTDLSFEGKIIDVCCGDKVLDTKTWTVKCNGTAAPTRQAVAELEFVERAGNLPIFIRVIQWSEPGLTVVVSIPNGVNQPAIPARDLDVSSDVLKLIAAPAGDLLETHLYGSVAHGLYDFEFPPEMIGQEFEIIVTFRGHVMRLAVRM
ncbi:MAG: hypothetical protein CHACPFDD_00453 [Phycisphaerae bacterium]|nr:hypothetical protein [Phycisphaerae bacterium]